MPEVDFDIQHQGEEEINNLQANGAGVAQQIRRRLVQRFWNSKFNILASKDNKIY